MDEGPGQGKQINTTEDDSVWLAKYGSLCGVQDG